MRRLALALMTVCALWLVGLGLRAQRHTALSDAGVTAVAEAGVEARLDPSRVGTRPPVGGARVEGLVTNDAGHALAGATVCATPFGGDLVDDEQVPYCTTSGETGTYAFPALPAATYEVTASAPGHRPGRAKDDVTLAGTTQFAVDVVLARGGVAIGGVVEDPLGRPVAGARVTVSALAESDDDFATVVTTSDAAGHYTAWVPPGLALVEVFTRDHVTADRRTTAPSTEDFSLVFGATLVGLVLDEAQVPVPFARIELVQHGESKSARTGVDGSYRFDSLRAGEAHVEATAEGLLGATLGTVLVVPGDLTTAPMIVVHPIARVVGAVRTPSGPCTKGSASLHGDGNTTTLTWASLSAQGLVRWPAVAAGTYRVEASCEGFARGSASLTVPESGTASFAIDVLRGATILGTVTDADGKPLTSGRVSASGGKGGYHSEDIKGGAFELTGVVAGSYEIEVRAKGHADGKATINVSGVETATVHLVLVRGASVAGLVVDELGKPMAGARVSYQATHGGGYGSAEIDAKGRYVIRDLPAGSGELTVERGATALALAGVLGGGGAKVTLSVGAATKTDLTVEACGHTLRGIVLDASGTPVGKARVQVGRRTESGGRGFDFAEGTTDSAGAFAIPGLPSGDYAVQADAPDLAASGFLLATPVDAAVTVKIAPLGRIVGTVAGAKSWLRVTVESQDLEVFRHQRLFGSAGVFVVSSLPAGTYTVTAWVGSSVAKEQVTLGAGGEQIVSLVPVASSEGATP